MTDTAGPGTRETVVIVHGTFAGEADWVLPDAEFAQRIKAGLPAADFQAFRWSGRNSHPARIEAGEELAAFLRALKQDGHGPFHLVGHSHGGNVILYALRDPAVRDEVASTTYLGTPFFQIAPRNLKRIVEPAADMSAWVLAFLIMLLVILPAAYVAERPAGVGGIVAVGLLVLSVPLGLAYGWVWRPRFAKALAARVIAWLSPKQVEVLDWVKTSPPSHPTFVAKVAADEAGLHLWAVDLASKLPWMLLRFARRTVWWAYGALIVASMTVEDHDALGPVFWVILIGFSALLITPLLGALWSAAWRGNRFTFGSEGLVTAATVRIAPSARPPWSPVLADVEKAFRPSKRIRGLRHCFFYQDPAVADAISAWISGLAEPSQSAGRDAWAPPERSRWWVGPLAGLVVFGLCMAILHGPPF